MDMLKYIIKCIIDGAKIFIPIIIALILIFVILNTMCFLLGEKIMIALVSIAIILIVSFVIGFAKNS